MPVQKNRFIVDTNLWISFLINGNFEKIEEFLFRDGFELIYGRELLDEFLDVIRRPKLRKYFSKSKIEIALEIIIDFAVFIEVTSQVNICRDPKDNFLLSLAIDSKAKFLVTGDQDLLILKSIKDTKIVSFNDFVNLNS